MLRNVPTFCMAATTQPRTLRRPAEAITQLEHLILTYPRSALIPQARRLLDEARTALSTT